MSATLEGGCLCGAFRYAIRGELGPIGFCHCHTCQKSEGVAFATTARVAREDFSWSRGEESSLRSYESSPGKRRYFCGTCGSKLFAAWANRDTLILRLGSLDGDPGTRPVVHIWTEDAVPWRALESELPMFPRGVPPRNDD